MILDAHRDSIQRQDPPCPPSLSADKVARAASLKRQESTENTVTTETKPETKVNSDGMTGDKEKMGDDSPLGKLRRYSPSEGLNLLGEVLGNGDKRPGISRRLFGQETLSGKEASAVSSEAKEAPPTPSSSEAKASPPTAAKPERTRRMKTVDKPVKTLGIASEGKEETPTESAPGSTIGEPAAAVVGPQSQPWTQLRKAVSHDERESDDTAASSTGANQPSWVAIAQVSTVCVCVCVCVCVYVSISSYLRTSTDEPASSLESTKSQNQPMTRRYKMGETICLIDSHPM